MEIEDQWFLKTIQDEENSFKVPRHCNKEERSKKRRKLQNLHWRHCLMRPYTWAMRLTSCALCMGDDH